MSARPPRIYASAYGVGLGHAYRTAALLRRLAEAGLEVVASSWGQGYRYLRSRGIGTFEVPGVDVVWGEEGRMRFKDTVRRLPQPFAGLARQLKVELAALDRLRPDLVISDSRLTPLLAAHLRGAPSILLINQLRLLAPHSLGPARAAIELPAAELLGLAWSAAEAVLVPDLPPPYTIAEEQVRGVLPAKGKLRFIGLVVEEDGCEAPELPGQRLALFTVSGPDETKRPTASKFAAAARLLAARGWTSLISLGIVGGDDRPRPLSDGVYICEWCGCLDGYLRRADVVVARSGHATVGKLVYYGKPSVLAPIPFHGEQESNALKAEGLGVARAILRLDLAPAQEVADAVDEVWRGGHAARAAALSRIARSMDPAAALLEEVRAILRAS